MFPQPTEFLLLFEQDHAHREAVAANERARPSRHFAASVLERTTRPVRRPHTARAG